MRLAQIARKINVNSNEIIRFITNLESGIDRGNLLNPNSKVPEELINQIINHFTEKIDLSILEVEKPNTISLNQEEETLNTAEKDTVINEVDGVIRVPKVEIPGVKIIGKIDLPVEKTEEVVTSEEEKEEKKNLPAPHKKVKKSRKHKSKTLSFEEKENQQKEQHERTVRRKKTAEKQKKKAHYENLMAERKKDTSKKKNKGAERQKAESKKEKYQEETPKTLWGKFLRWLNT